MKNLNRIYSSVFLFLVVCSSCDIEGVKEDKDYAPTPNIDTVKPVNNKLGQIDTTIVNFDSAFNFSENLPLDSITLKSGVKLTYLEKNRDGNPIKKFDVVSINYRGKLTDGKLIESNEALKKPVPFVVGLGMTFDAFDEVLEKCKTGDKVRFVIPADKAYGKKGRGLIPPNSDLVYEMDILDKVEGKKTASGVEYFTLYTSYNPVMPREGDKVYIGYMGWVKRTGKVFDVSAASGKLYEFVLGTGVAIKAWHEAVAEMHLGEKMLIIAPAETCYGSKGVPELVPPNSDLVYILELKNIEPGK